MTWEISNFQKLLPLHGSHSPQLNEVITSGKTHKNSGKKFWDRVFPEVMTSFNLGYETSKKILFYSKCYSYNFEAITVKFLHNILEYTVQAVTFFYFWILSKKILGPKLCQYFDIFSHIFLITKLYDLCSIFRNIV